jgi:hypothetical protein
MPGKSLKRSWFNVSSMRGISKWIADLGNFLCNVANVEIAWAFAVWPARSD